MNFNSVKGSNRGKVRLYALSTCGWCKKTKRLLDELGIAYDYIYVDLESEENQIILDRDLEKYDVDIIYPTIVIDDNRIIKGFDSNAIRGEFE
ncbi:glutaredoxin family protein [Alkalibaculum sp. M08DMB]|uniref:Glutaredoxin family protein n=1 Tax=Alkalibaculum sporogenes TaxID=2655001 RepID=A0A6A7KCD8_9FIRM|nr:glutaredoxin family protein [Alkalibaculum sporogenes]MPW26683.1 glutaredoxin family protein [Alkalibaculum sporogenes]